MTRQWVVVTGAASGIGESVARRLSNAGHGIVLVDFDEGGLHRVGADLPDSLVLACDLLGKAARNISGETIKVTGGMTTVGLDFHAGVEEYRSARVGS